MTTAEALSSKTAHQGQRFAVEVSEDVLVDGRVVIPRGARGAGEVSRVIEKGVFGKSGKLAVRIMFVEVGGTRIRLQGEVRDKGVPGTAPVLLAAPLIGLSASLFSGTSAKIPAGTAVDAFVADDLPLVAARR
jgi:hypothetical protein